MDIKLFISDLDGTLTDGKYYVADNGRVSKSFYTRDFYAMAELAKNNIRVVIATSATSGIVYKKLMSLPYAIHVISGAQDKKKAIEDYLNVLGGTWDNVAYIGDAENDMECIKVAALTCCPKDSIPDVLDLVDFASEYDGGNGAVWEFANYVLGFNKRG